MMQFNIDFSSAAVQAALISATGSIIAAALAALAAGLIGKQIAGRRKLAEKLDIAMKDLAFLLEVEAQHCEQNKTNGEGSQKLKMRDAAREKGENWSGRFTPGRVLYDAANK